MICAGRRQGKAIINRDLGRGGALPNHDAARRVVAKTVDLHGWMTRLAWYPPHDGGVRMRIWGKAFVATWRAASRLRMPRRDKDHRFS